MEARVLESLEDIEAILKERIYSGGRLGSLEAPLVFTFDLDLNERIVGGRLANFRLRHCTFEGNVKISALERGLNLDSCVFEKDFSCKNTAFQGKARLQNCIFHGRADFSNSKFNDLADFWRSTFKQETIFYKTDFLGTVVFSATSFEKNVLFTYTLIEKLILFRGTVIKRGIDLSTAIITGSVGTFGLSLWDFKAKKGRLTDQEFETAVSESGEIPIKNKRETFRILKQANIQQNNVIESIPYQVLEKTTLLEELKYSFFNPSSTKEWWRNLWDLFVLGLNWISNSFGRAPMQGVIFTLTMGFLFFYLNIMQTEKYELAMHLSWDLFVDEIPNYLKFLLPTHGLDYLGSEFYKKYSVSNWYYVWDIAGRIFVGFGIYQTIQAFRKFR